jgi:hypothetical protein
MRKQSCTLAACAAEAYIFGTSSDAPAVRTTTTSSLRPQYALQCAGASPEALSLYSHFGDLSGGQTLYHGTSWSYHVGL